MSAIDQILATAATRFAKAHVARMKARRERADYWRRHYPAPNQSEIHPGSHSFGTCQMRETYEGPVEDKTLPLCAVCAGSTPFHCDYLCASKERAAALRALLRLVAQAEVARRASPAGARVEGGTSE